jgi:hypothetical protein
MKSQKQRAALNGVPSKLIAALASLRGSTIFPSEVSEWLSGTPIAAHKVERLAKALDDVENLLNKVFVRPDLTCVDNVVLALAKLESLESDGKECQHPAVAPYTAQPSSPAANLLADDSGYDPSRVSQREAERRQALETAKPILSTV